MSNSIRAVRGYAIPVVVACLAVALLMATVLYPAHREATAREQMSELSQGLLAAVADLDKRRASSGAFPSAYQLVSAKPDFIHHYIATGGNQTYSLTAEHTELRLWAGVNSAGLRCHCSTCAGPTIFNQTTTACPAGTAPF